MRLTSKSVPISVLSHEWFYSYISLVTNCDLHSLKYFDPSSFREMSDWPCSFLRPMITLAALFCNFCKRFHTSNTSVIQVYLSHWSIWTPSAFATLALVIGTSPTNIWDLRVSCLYYILIKLININTFSRSALRADALADAVKVVSSANIVVVVHSW